MSVCPCCGYCPTCGRRNLSPHYIPPTPIWVVPQIYPGVYPIWTTSNIPNTTGGNYQGIGLGTTSAGSCNIQLMN